ncbi:MAG: hypothetical protein SAJ37_15430, partial [Oscillatoria sp. PMC 1068.18]|nr:hypothetical protein [Oscillatoria sp. PMC 1068.18]
MLLLAVYKVGIPQLWIKNLWEFPRSVDWMESLGRKLTDVTVSGRLQKPLLLSFEVIFIRNLIFLVIVLFHGLRRLF